MTVHLLVKTDVIIEPPIDADGPTVEVATTSDEAETSREGETLPGTSPGSESREQSYTAALPVGENNGFVEYFMPVCFFMLLLT